MRATTIYGPRDIRVETVADPKYGERILHRRAGEAFPFEQQMLGRWFDERFGGPKVSQAQ